MWISNRTWVIYSVWTGFFKVPLYKYVVPLWDGSHESIIREVHLFQVQLISVRRHPPSRIYGKPISAIQHKSDVVRLEALLMFGGFYADIDSLSLRSHAPLLNYSVTMGLEDFDSLANMAIFAEPHARHLYNWHHSYASFDQDLWAEWSIQRNLRIAKRCPDYVHIEPKNLAWPNWNDRYLYYSGNPNISESYFVHLYWRHIEHDGMTDQYGVLRSNYLAHRLLRGIYFGSCDICG